MSLDVHLRRSSNESWGFRLVGGADSETPLTIVKVTSSTPAQAAGLQDGDKLVRLHGVPAEILTHEEADIIIRSCHEDIVMQIERGRYDAVMDDQEALFESIDLQDDFVQQSEPTEVQIPTPILPIEQTIEETRSLTASPFLVPAKPYRPFSTEPIPEVTPVEDPIILNPNFYDEFIESLEEYLPKTKFKLPVSEQYDPNYEKEKKDGKLNGHFNLNKEGNVCYSKTNESVVDNNQNYTAEEINQIKQANIDIDLSKIEESTYSFQEFKTEHHEIKENIDINSITSQAIKETEDSVSTTNITEKEFSKTKITNENLTKIEEINNAASVFVGETIEQAKTVATIIKDEFEVALITDLKENQTEYRSDSSTKTEEVHESVRSLKQKFEGQTTKEVSVSEVKQDVIEVTEAGKVKNIASSFEKDVDININTKSDKKVETSQKQTSSTTENKKSQGYQTITKKRTTTENLNALNEQKAYVLGLQTIPNIRGTINSSKHFDLLLKTFFIHLTDVMVALSRFILVEPAFSKGKTDGSTENIVDHDTQEVITKEQIVTNVNDVNNISSKEAQKKTSCITEQHVQATNESEYTDTGLEMQRKDKKKESNIKMALMSSQTSKEVAHKMEAVISEFQTKTGIEDIHEDKMDETEHETLASIDKEESANLIQSENISERRIVTDTVNTTMTETSSHTSKEIEEITKGAQTKNTYMAIVEAHVYTNKEAVMEMDIKSSDTSRKSSIEELKSNANEILDEKVEISEIKDTNLSEKLQEKFEVAQIEEIQPAISFEFEVKNEIAIEDKIMSAQEKNMFLNVKENLKRVSIVDDILVQESQNFVQNTAVSIDEVVEKLETEILSKQTSNSEEIDSQIVVKLETNQLEKNELNLNKYDNLSSINEIETTVTQQAISKETVSQQQTIVKQEETLIRKDEQSFVSKQEISESKVAITETQKTHKADSSKLSLDLKSETKSKKNYPLTPSSSTPSTIDTPTPSTIPPTPLTDEYIFRIEAPMPKNRGTPTPTPVPVPIVPEEHEDPHIVKKRMIPHIDTNIERIVYDPPLLTPEVGSGMVFEERPFDKKPISREEIKEIERTSSLLASAIDETIKSIEEYKEQVGIEATKALDTPLAPNLDANVTSAPNPDANIVPNLDANAGSVPNTYSGTVQEAKTIVYSQPTIDIEQKSSFIQTQENINISNTIDATSTSEINGFRSVKFMPDIIDQLSSTGTENTKIEDVNGKMTIANEEMMIRKEELKESEFLNEGPTYRPVHFDPNEFKRVEHTQLSFESMQETQMKIESISVKTMTGTHQGIVDSLEEQIIDSDTAKELGKPGISEEKIAELMSGEGEMLREAHVMGLKRVLNSHMHRTDDENSSVDFMKIKPSIDSLRDSEVLKALNEELIQKKIEEKKKEEKNKSTTFLQKPKRPVPAAKHGYHGWLPEYEQLGEPYKVKIIKQPKPKVAPDYKPEVFETGPLPWEERAANEPPPPPVVPEDPILIPEEGPQFLEAVDPLPESEVPDLEDTGIQFPPEKIEEDQDPTKSSQSEELPDQTGEDVEVFDIEKVIEETEQILLQDMEENKIAEQLMSDVQGMVDPKATLEQQLTQMRAQLSALAQLPCVIQQTLDLVTKQLSQLTQQGSSTEVVTESKTVVETTETVEVTETSERVEESTEQREEIIQHVEEVSESHDQVQVVQETKEEIREEKQELKEERMIQETRESSMKQEMRDNKERVRRESHEIMDEARRIEMQKKELIEQLQQEHESRQLKQRPTPRVGKPKPAFGPLTPQERPLVLPGGRKWRKPADAYNEQFIAETLQAQAEIIQGKTKGSTYESHHLPYDERINFMKYEKPPISLDHLKDSDVYKMVHNMDQTPTRRVEMLTPVIAESDYREKCRAATPAAEKISR